MRIAYLLHYNPGPLSGVWAKIADQVDAWTASGHEVQIFMLAERSGPAVVTDGMPAGVRASSHSGRLDQTRTLGAVARQIEAWSPDLVYYRFDLFIPGMRRLARRLPIVLEINTDDIGQNRVTTRRRSVYNRLTRRLLLSRAAGAVFVAHETASRRHFTAPLRDVPQTVIGNGIALGRYAETQPPAREQLRAVLLAKGLYPWLGVEKTIWLASRIPAWRFDLVGISEAHLDTVALPPNVVAHGLLARKEYDRVMLEADLAIGVLSLHVIGMNETSSLKTREYLAYGLPLILGNRDADVPEDFPYVLRLPNTPTNVRDNLDAIVEFGVRMKGNRIPRSAVAHIDTEVKERSRLAFFDQILAGRGG